MSSTCYCKDKLLAKQKASHQKSSVQKYNVLRTRPSYRKVPHLNNLDFKNIDDQTTSIDKIQPDRSDAPVSKAGTYVRRKIGNVNFNVIQEFLALDNG